MNRVAFHNVTIEFSLGNGQDPIERFNEIIRLLNACEVQVMTTPVKHRSNTDNSPITSS